jgi:hypothetical protein
MHDGFAILTPNTATPGDDPNNRYDCDYCTDCPPPDELIQLIFNADGSIHSKFCRDHAIDPIYMNGHLANWTTPTLYHEGD